MDTLDKINKKLKEYNAKLVAVGKTHPVEAIQKIYDRGQRVFGENRVQEILEKKDLLPADIQWQMIGNLQRNKVKYIAPFIAMIHSVDSEKLLSEIQRQAEKNHRVIDILLEVHIAKENTKEGMSRDTLFDLAEKIAQNTFPNIQCRGVMGMATFTDKQEQVKSEFRILKTYFDKIKGDILTKNSFDTISMGMSGDYEMALEEGSNMVRIGSLIFGQREYK
ncbi:MAG: YggS family pyridoxal phosphate-dependent enzyme [Chitinophagales bacterium]|nr:YggS family pyridoxal phosphate-dependent enzyme [Chitinophagales bacterium]